MAFSACKANLAAAEKIGQVLPPLPRGGRPDGGGLRGVGEPALADILQDPMMRRLLASDGIQPDQLLELIRVVRERLNLPV